MFCNSSVQNSISHDPTLQPISNILNFMPNRPSNYNNLVDTDHQPVMLTEVIQWWAPKTINHHKHLAKSQGKFLDATFGAGGHSRALLTYQPELLIALDQDTTALCYAQELQKNHSNFQFHQIRFSQMLPLLDQYKGKLDGILFDLGVSSMQLDQPERGFNFKSTYLDMRMQQLGGITAADILAKANEQELTDIFYNYGEEPKAKAIAKKIVLSRKIKPITQADELIKLVAKITGKNGKINPATRIFQALRIAVNHELEEIQNGLQAAAELLKPQGRLLVISFHSLEDRIVKNFLKTHQPNNRNSNKSSRHSPTALLAKTINTSDANNNYQFHQLTKKPLTPSKKEQESNPRCRSAKLRVALKLQ